MELLVCIKQVPDDTVNVTMGADGAPKLDDIAPVVNAFDTYALEMAARFKEANGGSVTVLTIGGEGAVPALRSCLSVGADRACRVEEASVCDPQGTAYLLSQASKKAGEQPFDVIFCGSESTDAASGQVGAQLAETLGLPVITNVLALEPKDGGISAKQETEDGYRVVEAACPCVVTIVKPDYEPRYPSIKSKMAARKMPVAVLTAADAQADASKFGPEAAKVQRAAISAPPQRQSGVKIQEKEAAEAVRRAMEIMVGQKLI
ncbi:electron transfer flavoprotein subunit beta/FixA family protein [Oscillibacter sp.]|uniref:electron transfer flavoprotein subunit beta/FixA family protein n=1 Tax=Oscillibacter sp. TaxID=1945593 RepID=UPI00262B8A90|nr:electron transfer flavoprotein subunit beta/FixA family protein [Oscillibacter sp.]MDD3346199.1 electron transfer flavoprotein subunit beta/FixA family protein [Oscillibacter sp.]